MQIWWHAGSLKPDFLSHLTNVALPMDAEQGRWIDMAVSARPPSAPGRTCPAVLTNM